MTTDKVAHLGQAGAHTIHVHASCVSYCRKGVLILGAAGSGKSSLALTLLAHGAELVADDQVCIQRINGWPTAYAPKEINGLIEARGIGLLAAQTAPLTRIQVVIDLDRIESDRLPKTRYVNLLDQKVPLLHKSETPHFGVGLLQYLKGGRVEH